MVSGPGLQQQLDQKVSEIKQAVSGLSEEQASKAPANGEWSAKEVLSHLSGSDSTEFVARLKRILDEDTPRIDVTPGVSHYEQRKDASTGQLLSQVESAYGEASVFLAGLSEEQLNRKANVPMLKETPFGENVSLGQLAGLLINFHLNDHLNQLRNLNQR
jgi:uncharacterized damage-inducible protein DinB